MKKLLIENKYETEPMTIKFRKNNDANRVTLSLSKIFLGDCAN
jgi:hypothetical protein